MTLNIKDPQVHALARDLAKLRGVSMTQAVLDAVRRELARERDLRRSSGLAGQLLAIGRRCASRLGGEVCSADHAALLYDEQGLPRR